MPTSLPEIARVEFSGTFDGEAFMNVMHFVKDPAAAFTEADLFGLLTLLAGANTVQTSLAHIYQTMDSELLINRIYGRTLSNTVPIESEVGATVVGTSVGANAPPMLAALIRWNTTIASRRSRGRTYLCGINVGMIAATDADRLVVTTQGSLTTRATAFAAAYVSNPTYSLVVLSNVERDADVPIPYKTVLSGVCQPRFAVQRRRRQAL